MNGSKDIPWEKILDYLAEIGSEKDLGGMIRKITELITSIVEVDNSIIFHKITGPAQLTPLHTVGCSKKWLDTYGEHYHAIEPPVLPGDVHIRAGDWRMFKNSEYVEDFILPQGIRYAAGLVFLDPDFHPSYALGLQRSRSGRQFDERDLRILNAIHLHLTNYLSLATRLSELEKSGIHAAELSNDCSLLSRREAEIVSLLAKRAKPVEIATLLMISLRTVRKHIENIYRKLNVTTRHQLMQKILLDKQ